MNLRLAAVIPGVCLLAACGSAASSGSATSGPASGSATSGPGSATSGSGSATSAPSSGSFPLTVSRTGGIAGFHDVVVVGANGQTSVTVKQGAATTCRIGPDAFKTLSGHVTSLLKAPKLVPPTATPDHAVADAIIITVVDGAGTSYLLPDPPSGAAQQAVVALVDDVTGPAPPHQICVTT